MKKILTILVIFILVSTIFSVNLKANSTKFYANFGIMTDDSFTFDPFLWYIGANIDFSINDLLMISPEVNVLTYKFKFSAFLLEPAVLANFKFGSLFVGAGVTTFVLITGSTANFATDVALKINAGIKSGNLKFRIFLITPFNNIFKSNVIGAQVGIGF